MSGYGAPLSWQRLVDGKPPAFWPSRKWRLGGKAPSPDRIGDERDMAWRQALSHGGNAPRSLMVAMGIVPPCRKNSGRVNLADRRSNRARGALRRLSFVRYVAIGQAQEGERRLIESKDGERGAGFAFSQIAQSLW